MHEILLLDNGSRRPQSTLALRALADRLAQRLKQPVQPVSLAHADQIPPAQLEGQGATTLEPWLLTRCQAGVRHFLILPLFFGPSAALTQAIPALTARLSERMGPMEVRLAPPLCPLPQGEPRLTRILIEGITTTERLSGAKARRLVLVDHGSPSPEVNASRRWLAADLRRHLGPASRVEEAAMERRAGAQYDFNGAPLLDVLHRLAAEDSLGPLHVVPLFLFAGRHAGPSGDLDQIAHRVKAKFPTLSLHFSGLVGDHPALVDILASRYREAA